MSVAALVDRERRHLLRAELATGMLRALGALAVIVGAGAVALGGARWLTLPRGLPLALWMLAGATSAALVAHSLRGLRRRGSRSSVALAIEREQGLRRGVLVGAMELEGHGGGGLAARAAHAARASLPNGVPLAPAMRQSSRRRAALAGALAAGGALLLATASPLFADGLRVVLRPLDAWRGELLARPRIVGAPRELVRGARLALVIEAAGRARVFLTIRQTGEAWRTDTLAVDAAGTARWTGEALQSDVRLVASDGRTSSDTATVHLVERPFVGAVTLRAEFPPYLARPAESLPVGEPLRVPRGTVIVIAGRASVPLARVTLSGGGATHALMASGHTFAGRLVATQSVHLRWSATGGGAEVADVPPPLEVEVLSDAAPRVSIEVPAADTVLAADDAVVLGLTASDDHGIGSLLLRTTRGSGAGDGASTTAVVAERIGTSWAGRGVVDVAALGLQPGDIVRVRAEAVDASPWAQRGVSRELVIKRPTMEERRDVVRALGDSAVSEARSAASAQRSLAQRTSEAARAQSRSATPPGPESAASGSEASRASMNYESAEKARGLAREQRAMAERVERLRDATAQLSRQLAAAGALDTSLARQLGEAQALLRQALTPELAAQMQRLESAAQQLDGEASREAMRNLAQMQQRMREQLERSAEILKRAAHEGAMQTLGDQARELAQRQRSLGDSAARAGGEAAEARESARLAEQAGRLRGQMEELERRLSADKAEAGARRTSQAGAHAAKSETGMRRASTELAERGATPDAAGAERARDAAAEMERAAESMREAREAQVKEWKQELTAALDQGVQEMMQLAREERALEQQARQGASPNERRGAQSAVEQGVEKASERLQGAGRKSALLSPRSQRAVADAREKVSQATRAVTQPATAAASQQQAGALGEAADALTRAAAALARDRERANAAGSASGFEEMLRELQQAAQQQGQINGQAQGLLTMPGGAAGEAGQALARALARQQRGVADKLDDAGDAVGGDRAAQLAREARQLADRLDGGRLDAGTLARQQQLFRRLLDAGRSLEKEEREDSGKREATAARGGETFAPTGAVDARAANRFRPPTWDELRGLTADERRAILDYFSRLNHVAPR